MGIQLDRVVNRTRLDHLTCQVCNDLPIEPRILNQCEHVFCKECIELHWGNDPKLFYFGDTGQCGEDQEEKHYCPVCRQLFIQSDIKKCYKKYTVPGGTLPNITFSSNAF